MPGQTQNKRTGTATIAPWRTALRAIDTGKAHRATKLTEEMPDQKKTRALAANATVSHTASWMPLSAGQFEVWEVGPLTCATEGTR